MSVLGRFLILRHALTSWNQEKRIQGQTDIPLSDMGVAMARGWTEKLAGVSYDAVLTSDLSRAVQTGTILNMERNPECEVRADRRLREQDWGRWVGMSLPEVVASQEYEAQTRLGWDFRPPAGESRLDVLRRAMAALRDAAEDHPGRTWLTVSHQGVIKALIYHLRGHDMLPGHQLLDKRYRAHEILVDSDGLRLGGEALELSA
jgi:probable phosphoglycerate mutase